MKKKTLSVPGFLAGAVAAGIRYPDRLDLGLILAEAPCSAAGLFTKNQVRAPSVELCEQRLKKGKAQAVLANSGNANACVGPRGLVHAKQLTAALAELTGLAPHLVLMNSTGVIGEPLPLRRIQAALPPLFRSINPEGLPEFGRAIMTTDTRLKIASRRLKAHKEELCLAGVAKGAGMIMPDLATMLVYLLTDAAGPPPLLRSLLRRAVHQSFNALTIDGDTSTNDSVIIMASGRSGLRLETSPPLKKRFAEALDDLCRELALEIARDGEGATRYFHVRVEGATSAAAADRVARRVANSPLVKTALHAGDPNWGRIMAAVGSAGVRIRPEKVEIVFQDDRRMVQVVEKGARSSAYSEKNAEKILSGSGFTINIRIGNGPASRSLFSCDFSPEYVRINADYRS